MTVVLTPGRATLSQWRAILGGEDAMLDASCAAAIAAGADAVAAIRAWWQADDPAAVATAWWHAIASARE